MNGKSLDKDSLSPFIVVPLSQGKPIEWKIAAVVAALVKDTPVVPLSQGKPIEWKTPPSDK